uniref:Chaoptin n=2 Tax=Parascaris univalens TaxID=6257 RepID=A0A915B1N2_PARUN
MKTVLQRIQLSGEILCVLLNVIIISSTINIESTAISLDRPCTFDAAPNSKWKSCMCENIDGESSLHIRCRRQPWITVPAIPYDQPTPYLHNETVYSIVALSIIESSLAFLSQDAFKNQNIQLLDLTHNHIETINVNAFRTLESKLYQLTLNENSLSSIPAWALTYLHQLQYLHLQQNMIAEIKPHTFDETQLKNLHYLHLDHNQITILPRRSLYRLPLEVLTMANNRLSEIEKLALPPSIWFIDMKNNVLQQIPYLAIRELKTLRNLDLEGNNITQIAHNPEVEFTSEIDLILSNNRIVTLDDNAFNSFQKFNRLDLSYNQISTVSASAFSSISHLRQLDLSYNKIVHIPAGTFTNVAKSMQRLNLEENQLHTLPAALQQLRTLEYLNLNSNKLITFDNNTVNNLKPALAELLLAFNRLTEIPTQVLDGMSKLKHLDLAKNRIRSVNRLAFGTFDGTGTSLIRLNLAGNLIEQITDPGSFLYMSSLAYLDLSYNRLNNISDNAFERLEGLESLFLQNNALTVFPKAALSRLHKLRYLLLDGNPIESLPDSAFNDMGQLERLSISRTTLFSINDHTFFATSIRNLKSLNLAFCRIRHIASRAFYKLSNLQQLLLNDNQLTTINSMAFASLYALRQLNLAGNYINVTMERAIYDIPTLEYLSLARNQMQYISKASLVNVNNLEHLDLSYNQLRAFDFSFLQQNTISIKQLDLSHNHIVMVDLSAVKRSLCSLNLSHNQLQSIGKETMRDFDQMNTLDLSNNGLIEVQSNAFLACPKLRILNLSYNHLRTLYKGTFANQESYENLCLAHNAIVGLDADTFGVDNVQYLDLSNNELKKVPQHALASIRNSIATLNLKGNRIRSLDVLDFNGMNNLSELILADNHIETIEEAAFASMPKLMKLDLSHNPVVSWNPHAFKELSHSIESLNLANTGLFSLPRITNRGLRHLNISKNKIHELSASDLLNHNKLISFDISFNNFKKIDPQLFDTLVELKHLNISGNRIERLTEKHFESLYHLETLAMYDMNGLHRLPEPRAFRHLRHLRNLYIYNLPLVTSYNISEMLRHLPPLRTLAIEIKEARLSTQLYRADLRLLRNIIITGQQLTKIDTGAFAHLRGYKIDLTVRDSGITEFPSSIFNTLTSVSFLSLSLINNHIETLNPFTHTKSPVINQHGTILHNIHLAGNPIMCDCRLKWITSWLQYAEGIHLHTYVPLNDSFCVDQAGGGVTLYTTYSKPNHLRCTTTGALASTATYTSSIFVALYLFITLFTLR